MVEEKPTETSNTQHQQQQQQTQQQLAVQQTSISAVSIKLPQLRESNAAAWFVITEAQFNNANISTDTTKYNYVISSLSNELATKIIHVITKPPDQDKYNNLKNIICSLLEPSESYKAKQLANLNGLGDMAPSQLLNHMRCLCGQHEETPLFKEIFLRQLPNHTRSISICADNISLTSLAKKADLIISYTDDICQIQIYNSKNTQNLEINYQELCFYHRRFGVKARKCVKPCNF